MADGVVIGVLFRPCRPVHLISVRGHAAEFFGRCPRQVLDNHHRRTYVLPYIAATNWETACAASPLSRTISHVWVEMCWPQIDAITAAAAAALEQHLVGTIFFCGS